MKPKINPSISGIWHIDLKPGAKEFIVLKKPVETVKPGMLVMIKGRGFGDNPERVNIRIGPLTLKPLPKPLFGEEYAIISFPKVPAGRHKLSVSVDGVEAAPVEIVVESLGETGSIMLNGGIDNRIDRFFRAVELYLIMAEKEVKLSLELGVMPDLAESALKTYRSLREALEELKSDVAKMDDRARRNFIRALEISGAAEKLEIMAKYMKKGGISAFAHMVEQIGKGLDAVSSVLDSIKDCVPPPFNCAISIISGGVKTANQVGKIIAQSDAYQKARENEEEDKKWKDKVEGKLDRLEGKLDKAESKLDKLEKKADKAEGKIDKLEGKLDKAESKLDKLERKGDKQEAKLELLEQKADKIELKLDKLENKVELVEVKLDKAESKLDKLEKKADKAEGKLDRLEGKLDKAESKIDRLDKSVGKVEGKSDVMEKKLDGLRSALGGVSTAIQGLSSQAAMLKKDIEKLEAKSDTLTSSLSDVKDKLDKVQERIEIARRRVREILDRIVALEERLKT